MINTILYDEKYKTNICFIFILCFIVIQPLLKYCEYVLEFPRINLSIIFLLLFYFYLLSMSKSFFKNQDIDLLLGFWLLLFISGIQILSMPWAVYYRSNGIDLFLKIISKTFFCYWMFWLSGLHIKNIIEHKYSRLFFSISWLLSVSMIFISILNNDMFSIILNGKNIYLMLADCFAVLSILALIHNKKFDIYILLISNIALFALLSRASLYSFFIISVLYMIKEHKIKFLFLLLLLLLLSDYFMSFENTRMLRLLFGGFDGSQALREKWYLLGMKDLRLIWPIGYFMGDVSNNYGHTGTYIHSYLSYLRQF